jgi:hypothetical protein
VLDGAAAVVVQLLVVVGADVAAREHFFEMLEERRIDRHHVFEVAVNGAVLQHHDLAVLLGDRGLDLADLFVEQRLERTRAVENRLARFAHAGRAQRVGLARPAQRRLGLLVRFRNRLLRPFRGHGRSRVDLVQARKKLPCPVGGNSESLFGVLDWRVHLVALLGVSH